MNKDNLTSPGSWIGEKYQNNLTIKEITAIMRKELKLKFPACKFSVVKDHCNYISIALMEAPREVLNEGIEHNSNMFKDDERLNEYGKEIFNFVNALLNDHNFDDSDSQTDYFHVNYYHSANVGKWDKSFMIIK